MVRVVPVPTLSELSLAEEHPEKMRQRREAGMEYLKPAPNDFLQRWPVSKRVNSSRANAEDATLIERAELASV